MTNNEVIQIRISPELKKALPDKYSKIVRLFLEGKYLGASSESVEQIQKEPVPEEPTVPVEVEPDFAAASEGKKWDYKDLGLSCTMKNPNGTCGLDGSYLSQIECDACDKFICDKYQSDSKTCLRLDNKEVKCYGKRENCELKGSA